jgi:hypothetical protein
VADEQQAFFLARIFCYPEHDLDVLLKSGEQTSYCWNVTEALVDASRFDSSPSTVKCPRCGNYVEVRMITQKDFNER